MIIDALQDTVIDSLKLLPFLFITYLAMEYIEHKMGNKTKHSVQNAGLIGPLIGGIAGVVPQCGFSAAASNLYAGKVITVGTLLAIYLSTSDEMLPILISEAVDPVSIIKILGLKMIIGILAGFLVDFVVRKNAQYQLIKTKSEAKKDNPFTIKEVCEQEHCHCSDGLLKSAAKHTFQVFVFIFLISAILNLVIGFIGEESLGNFILNKPVIGELLAGIIGLIPNCAASVVLTELYLEGAMNFGAMMAGLLVGAGVGLLVLFRVHHNVKKNLQIVAMLYGIGVLAGILLDILGIVVVL